MERFNIAGRLVSIRCHPFVAFRGDIQAVRFGVGIEIAGADTKESCGEGGLGFAQQRMTFVLGAGPEAIDIRSSVVV